MIIALSHAPGKHAQQLFRGIAPLLAPHELLSWQTGAPAPAQDIQILLTLGAVPRERFESQAQLELIQTLSAGYESVDLAAADELGIWVSNAPAGETGNATSVAEFAVLLLAFEPGPRLHDGLDLVPALRGLLLETDKLGRLDGGTFVALLPGASGGRARSTLKSILARSSAVPGGLRAQLVDLPEGGSAADLLDRSARALAPTGPAGRV